MHLLAVPYVLKTVDITDVILILQETVRRLCLSVCLAGPRALSTHRQLESSSCTPGVSQLSFHPDGISSTQKELSTPKLFPKHGKQANGSVADSPSRALGQCVPSWAQCVPITSMSCHQVRSTNDLQQQGIENPSAELPESSTAFQWCVWLSHPCFTGKMNNDVMSSFCSAIKIPNKLDGYSNLLEFYLLFFKLKAVLFLIVDNSNLKRQGGESLVYKTWQSLTEPLSLL